MRSCCELPNPHNIADFFVMHKYRRLGVGKFSAKKVFDIHKGDWKISQWSKNLPAQKFWKTVINEYTSGQLMFLVL